MISATTQSTAYKVFKPVQPDGWKKNIVKWSLILGALGGLTFGLERALHKLSRVIPLRSNQRSLTALLSVSLPLLVSERLSRTYVGAAELHAAQNRASSQTHEPAQIGQQLEQMTQRNATLEQQLRTVNEEISSLRMQLAAATAPAAPAEAKDRQIEELSERLRQKEQEIADLRQQLSALPPVVDQGALAPPSGGPPPPPDSAPPPVPSGGPPPPPNSSPPPIPTSRKLNIKKSTTSTPPSSPTSTAPSLAQINSQRQGLRKVDRSKMV